MKNQYNIVVYCSKKYQRALNDILIPSFLVSDAHDLYVYTDFNKKNSESWKDLGVLFRQIFAETEAIDIHCSRKAEALLYHLEASNGYDETNIILMDVDCLITDKIEGIFNHDFDIGATVYNVKHNKRLKNVSAGILFIKHNIKVREFVRNWVECQDLDITQSRIKDQRCLSNLLYRNKTNLNILQLPCDIYNSHPITGSGGHLSDWIDNKINTAKVLHFAFGLWKNKKIVSNVIKRVDKRLNG